MSRRQLSIPERIAKHTSEGLDGHLIWLAAANGNTLTTVKRVDGVQKAFNVKQWIWEQAHGPTTKTIFSACGIDRCVALDHLAQSERKVPRKQDPRAIRISSEERALIVEVLHKARTSGLRPIDVQQDAIGQLISKLTSTESK